MNQPLLKVRGLKKHFPIRKGLLLRAELAFQNHVAEAPRAPIPVSTSPAAEKPNPPRL